MIGWPSRYPRPSKILILKPSSLGDVIHALPVLRLLKRQIPESKIYWWINSGLADLLSDDPDLDGLYLFDRKRWTSPWVAWAGVRQMRVQRFDWVIDLQCLARSGIVSWLVGGQLVVGLAELREGAPMFYDLVIPRPSEKTHAVDWYLEVVRSLGLELDWDFQWFPERPELAAQLAKRWHLKDRRWVLLQPGARWTNKRWPLESFIQLARNLKGLGVSLAVLGGKDECWLGARMAEALPGQVLDLTGQLSLPELAEWLRAASVLVTNDTGPMHLAVALGTPVVSLFGPTSPWRTGPYGQENQVLQASLPCVPCMKSSCRSPRFMECLTSLTVEQVAEAVGQRLQDGRWTEPEWR